MLSLDAGSWLAPFLRIAAHAGEEAGLALWSTLGVQPPEEQPSERQISVTLGRPLAAGDAVVMRLTCRAAGYVTLFRELAGSMEVARVSEDASELTIAARCKASGRLPSAAAGRRVAEHAAQRALESFLSHLRTAIEESEKGIRAEAPK
jgi:hypothetical protein